MHVVYDKILNTICWTAVEGLRDKQESVALCLSQMIL